MKLNKLKIVKIFFFIILLFNFRGTVFAQSKQELQNYISKNLGYQHIDVNKSKLSQIIIYKIEFTDCRLSYGISKKVNGKTERYKVWINLRRNSKIEMVKSTDGFQTITFAGSDKSMFKEYSNGDLIYEKIESIPMKKNDSKALEYFKKLIKLCKE